MAFFERYRNRIENTNPIRSLTKWIASEMIAMDPDSIPPTTSRAMKMVARMITVVSLQ